MDDWNPNYIIENQSYRLQPTGDSTATVEELSKEIMTQLKISDSLRSTFRPAPNKLQLFFGNINVTVELSTWQAEMEVIHSRSVFRETNYLHFNVPKKVWTYIADIFAAALIYLAVTGIFMIEGEKDIKCRGKWLVGFGLLIPLAFLLVYYL